MKNFRQYITEKKQKLFWIKVTMDCCRVYEIDDVSVIRNSSPDVPLNEFKNLISDFLKDAIADRQPINRQLFRGIDMFKYRDGSYATTLHEENETRYFLSTHPLAPKLMNIVNQRVYYAGFDCAEFPMEDAVTETNAWEIYLKTHHLDQLTDPEDRDSASDILNI